MDDLDTYVDAGCGSKCGSKLELPSEFELVPDCIERTVHRKAGIPVSA